MLWPLCATRGTHKADIIFMFVTLTFCKVLPTASLSVLPCSLKSVVYLFDVLSVFAWKMGQPVVKHTWLYSALYIYLHNVLCYIIISNNEVILNSVSVIAIPSIN